MFSKIYMYICIYMLVYVFIIGNRANYIYRADVAGKQTNNCVIIPLC